MTHFNPNKITYGVLCLFPILLAACGGGGGGGSAGTVTAPTALTGVTATAASSNQINLAWTAATGATGYNVYRGTAAGVVVGVASKITATPLTVTRFNDTPLGAGKTYFYTVTTLSATGESVGSAEVSATTSAPPVIHVSASVTTPATWKAGNVYAVDNAITVSSVLTIEPGTIVKMNTGKFWGMTVGAGGTINANGTAAAPIVFTSIKDDASGGDSNGDGAATTPAMNDWGAITLGGSGSVFNYVQFYYSGGSVTAGGPALDLGKFSATVTRCTFAHNNGGGVASNWEPIGALNASDALSGTLVSGNTFYDNRVPLGISGTFNVDNTNVFHDPANPATKNVYNGIFHMGHSAKPINGLIGYSATDAPFVISGYIDVPTGAALTLGDNVVVKFMSKLDSLSTSGGVIKANATTGNRIVFTSFRDDAHGGDTNGDGTVTAAATGDWAEVKLGASGSVFNLCEFYYAGGDTFYKSAISLGAFSATLTNSIFAYNDGGTIAEPFKAVLDAQSATSTTVISGNTFYGNNKPMLLSGLFSESGNVFHNPATPTQTNKLNGIFMSGNSLVTIAGNLMFANTEVPYVLHGDIQIPNGASITLGNNVVLKFYAGTQINQQVSGNLTYVASNVFTSLGDDTRLGDTNGDGAATAPVKGDWWGLKVGGMNWLALPNEFYNLY